MQPRAPGPIRAAIVDDSRVMRTLLQAALEEEGDIRVVGAAADPYEAREVIRATSPDVVTLDVEMPHMGGLEFLRLIMKLRPMPVVMVAATTAAGTETTLNALELGAVDFTPKPSGPGGWGLFAPVIRDKVRGAALARMHMPGRPVPTHTTTHAPAHAPAGADAAVRPASPATASPGLVPAAVSRPGRAGRARARQPELIAIGASTGGVAAINRLLAGFPPGAPPVVIAQHMPPEFTARFASRLQRLTGLDVAEARDREPLAPGSIRIAPGGSHLRVARTGGRLVCRLGEEPPVGGHRPSIDVLFDSVSESVAGRALGLILTGMGSDGAAGLQRMRAAGADTLGEAEASCVVYGMPKAAMRLGAVAEELEIDQLAARLRNQFGGEGGRNRQHT